MTREDLVDWLLQYGCTQEPIEGINVTGYSVRYYNPKTGRTWYVKTPIDETIVPDYIVCHGCNILGIPIPDCVKHEHDRYNNIKDRFKK